MATRCRWGPHILVFWSLLLNSILARAEQTELKPVEIIGESIQFSEGPFEKNEQWYLRSEAIMLRRRRVDERTFVVGPGPSNTRLLTTTAWTTPAELSGRFTLGRRFTANTTVELIGWLEDDFEDYTAIAGITGMRQPFFGHDAYTPRPRIGDAPAFVELAYQSQVQSIELDVRHFWLETADQRLQLGILAGPRFFRLQEQFQDYDSLTSVRGATTDDSLYQTWVDNRLYGGQLGGLIAVQPMPGLTILSETKWGGFANVTNATNRFATQDGVNEYFIASTPETRFSGILEFGLQLRARVTDRLHLWLGYHAMYFWNMTSAPDVLSFDLLNQSKQNNELAFWVHGPTSGLEIHF